MDRKAAEAGIGISKETQGKELACINKLGELFVFKKKK